MASLPPVAHNMTPAPAPVGLRASAAAASRPLLAPMVTPFPAPAASPALGSRASLYVGDLDRGVAEGQLFMIFSQVAPVASLRVCRDIAGRSLGYGYVNFHSREDAKRALETLNFVLVNGKSIRVMFSNRDPMLRNNGKANVFIKNLESDIDNKALNDIFSGFGTILSCKVATNLSGHSKGYGFVQFEDEKSAKDAINGLNGKLSNGKILFFEFTEDDLHQEFAPFGDITSAIVLKDADGKSKCFGFVNYEKLEYATEAIRIINGKMVKGTILYVARAQKKAERQAELKAKFERERTEKLKKFEGLNLYIKNLDDSINDVHLRNLFENFGEIASCKVMVDSQGRSMGYGFVSFQTAEAVHKAIDKMNGHMVGKKPLYVCVAQRKEERRAILVAHFARLQNIGLVEPVVPQNIPPHLLYSSPVAPVMFSPQVSGLGYHHYTQPHIYPLISLGGPNAMMAYNMMSPMHHGQRVDSWRGVGQEISRQHQRVHQNVNQNITYLANVRNGPTNDAMAILDFVTPIVARSLAPTDPTGPANVRNGPTNDAMAILDFVTPIVARSLAPTDPTGPGTYTLERSNVTADQEKQHQILGKKLYTLVEQLEPEFTEKVTKILLELEKTEVLHLIESANDLREKVCQAMEALRCRKAEDASEAANVTCTLLSSSSSKDSTSLVSSSSSID
uniref:Uncharacterized protein n=1 Tax=Avena sativa TaxID=4498 RepID=A0ACD6A8Z1_AVESA